MIFCALSEEDSHNKPPHHWQILMPMYLNGLSVQSAVGFGLDSVSLLCTQLLAMDSLLLLPNEVHCIACEKDIIKENNK